MTFGAAAAKAGMASRTVAPAAAKPPRVIRRASIDPPRGLGRRDVGRTLLRAFSRRAPAGLLSGSTALFARRIRSDHRRPGDRRTPETATAVRILGGGSGWRPSFPRDRPGPA